MHQQNKYNYHERKLRAMTAGKTTIDRRSFLKAALLAGGGMVLHFNWPGAEAMATENILLDEQVFELNSYIKIHQNGQITLFNPNPEFGQNVKTSLPMILAEELDVDWDKVQVLQADFFPERYGRQFTGGSQSIRQAWPVLRNAGATARQMLLIAAAQKWSVPVEEITTNAGVLLHQKTNRKLTYGEVASAAASVPIPKEVKLKNVADFKIIGTSKQNVELDNIITGKPLFTSDYKQEGMLIAMIVHPPAFGQEIKSIDDSAVRSMPGIRDVFVIETLTKDFKKNFFDATSFSKLAVVVGDSTWEVMQAKKKLILEFEHVAKKTNMDSNGNLESTERHYADMDRYSKIPGEIKRKDGDPETAFKNAARIIERTYTAPYLVHNTMEPVSCFAHVTADSAVLYAPIQAPEVITGTLVARLGLPKEKIKINLARMGGGFGLRAYGHHLVEAAIISQKIKAPVKLMYTREDEATYGIYRPTYSATYRAALDKDNQLIGFHVKAGGVPESPLHENRFPAGAIDNYLAESWQVDSEITVGAFRAPRSNFIASAEQSFLDELAFEMKKDPIDFRLELLTRAKENPVGKSNDYDAARYAGVIQLLKEKGDLLARPAGTGRGIAAYFCHNTYAAALVDVLVENNEPRVVQAVAAMDCGIVVNKDAATNMAEGAVIDGIGNSLYGEQLFRNGIPQKSNFNTYRIIRMNEIPRHIEIHFVDNQENPTGMGEPLFPPMFGAVANALYQHTGQRFYNQPFINRLTDAKKKV
ncbi:molybdopterin-dependent oxidoreductase [Sphingobacterium sp. SRCM116780]|uniref:xanthine dehydrogenase family protein molybdopterin-binding subunit n=1 Tax=Sphingobacterium sp. SRCM116780 TaxID=2907623 RepID=UPI001F456EE7|nr:molybdopterin cofactor-binding domain-containing protein [Sphingobacterium sp. SRCM116780]UIR56860.1 molybdopterin-dependent oxidoreductase [Sphingobacterium sp. SRCM116780]